MMYCQNCHGDDYSLSCLIPQGTILTYSRLTVYDERIYLLLEVSYGSIFIRKAKKRRGVAQPGSAPEWGSGGRRFKSGHPDFCKSERGELIWLPLIS